MVQDWYQYNKWVLTQGGLIYLITRKITTKESLIAYCAGYVVWLVI